MTISFTSDGTTSQILHNGTPALQTDASGNVSVRTGGALATIADLQSIGIGQTLQDMTASRAYTATYTNSTNRPRLVTVTNQSSGTSSNTLSVDINSAGAVPFARRIDGGSSTFANASGSFLVPPGATYAVTTSGGSLGAWYETF